MITNKIALRARRRKSFRKRRLEGKPLHVSALSTRPYDEKTRARRKLQDAVRLGWIQRPLCEGCGTNENVQGHHADYSKPLVVDWLCGICHAAEHRGELVRTGPKAPAILTEKPCSRCGASTPRSQLRGQKTMCNQCAKETRPSPTKRCANCRVDLPLVQFRGGRSFCDPCAARVRPCSICGETKELVEFSGRDSRCKSCNARRVALGSVKPAG